ncbi:MAG: class I SAM-dependent methyltransferase [Dehalococcoidia bacterium]|nr:class I SAM-dependent methyltransferase [Dehalococcoidia bacterium]
MPGNGYEDYEFTAEYYDPVYDRFTRRDIEFYVEQSKRAGGRTLELGCGTGRVLIPTALAGCEITGLDLSSFMLGKLQQKLERQPPDVQKRVGLSQGDMTGFDTGERYALITIPFRPFQHLITVAEQKACLTCVRRHLLQNGRFVLDVFHPSIPRLIDPKYLMEIETDPGIEMPDGRVLRRAQRIAAFHQVEQYNDIELIHYIKHPDGKEERLVHAFPMRYFYRYEMEHLLGLCGFRVVEFYGNFDHSPFTAESPEMIFIAEKV